jgi:hypothetical protein
VLRSTGDNLAFRKELLELASRVLEHVEGGQHSASQTYHISCWQDTIYPEYCPRTSAPGGILPSRLDWLCQPAHIERTLHLLFYLNHWAKAREHLLYGDRQGLYEVKSVVLQQAYKVGAVDPVAYIDGSEAFARDYSYGVAVDIATEVFIDRFAMSFDGNEVLTDEFDLYARKLFTHITGYQAKAQADSVMLDEKRVETFIRGSLQELVDQARVTRQPIPSEELAALFIQPADLFEVYLSRDRLYPGWDELSEGEIKQLDPEGLSLIAFQYNSSTAHYVFHLPLRVAEKFLPSQLVRELQSSASTSRETGTFYGQAITEDESQQYPIENLLRELLVDIVAICPHSLVKKEQRFRYARNWSTPDWENDESDDWYEDCLEDAHYANHE